MTPRKTLLVFLVFLLAAPFARGESGISVKDPWVRLNPPGTSITAAYLVIENPGAGADELISVRCACSAAASLHVTEMREDSMVMKEVASIAIAPGASVSLAPGGHHVMLMGLSGDMGESVVLELEFRSGARISVTAPVLSPSAAQKHSHH